MFLCATKGAIPTPIVANACTSLACYVALSATLLHVHKCAWLHEVKRVEEAGDADDGRLKQKHLSSFIYTDCNLMFYVLSRKKRAEVAGVSKMSRLSWWQHGTEKAQHMLRSWVQLLQQNQTWEFLRKSTAERNSLHPGYKHPWRKWQEDFWTGQSWVYNKKLISNSEMKMAARWWCELWQKTAYCCFELVWIKLALGCFFSNFDNSLDWI